MKKLKKVELIPAFSWICDKCGSWNYDNCVLYECDEKEMNNFRKEHNVENDDMVHLFRNPDVVTCKKCKEQYITVDYGDEL